MNGTKGDRTGGEAKGAICPKNQGSGKARGEGDVSGDAVYSRGEESASERQSGFVDRCGVFEGPGERTKKRRRLLRRNR